MRYARLSESQVEVKPSNLSSGDEGDPAYKSFPPQSGAGSPFEGGVVGKIDYLVFTVFYFPTGVVDSLIDSKQVSVPET
jgi:hypothetical protein